MGRTYGSAILAFYVEALACLHALVWVQQNQLQHINMFNDSTNLVKALQDHFCSQINLIWTIEKIRILANAFTWCCVTKVLRNNVADADLITKKCLAMMTSFSTTMF